MTMRAGMCVGKCGLAVILLVTGGCSDDAPETGGPMMGDKPVTLTYYRHDDVAIAAADRFAFDAYKKLHPNVTFDERVVNYNALLSLLETDFASGALKADLINMPPSYACGYTARLSPIPAGTLTGVQAGETFLAAPLAGATCGEMLMGLPREYNLEYGGILVNMKRYRAKLPDRSPANWKTWDDVLKDAKDLTEYDATGKITVAGLELRHRDPIKHILLALILQQGGTFWNADHSGFTFDTPQAIKALAWLGDLARVHKVLNVDNPPPSRWAVALLEVVEERGAMVYIGTWGHAIAREIARMQNTEVDLAYFRHPPFFGDQHLFVQNSGWSLVVPKNSENAAVALDVAKFVTTDPPTVAEWNRLAGSISPLRTQASTAALASDSIKAPIQPLLELGRWVGYIPPVPLTETRQIWFTHILSVMSGQLTPELAAQTIHRETNESMARAR